MSLPLSIEPMTSADLDQVLAIERASFRLPWSRRAFLSELALPYTIYRVVRLGPAGRPGPGLEEPAPRRWHRWPGWAQRGRSGATLVGYAGMQVILDEGHIMTIAVHPGHRQRGYGELLLVTLLGEAAGQGVLRLTLEVRTSNGSAQALYQKYGFTVEGRRLRYYGDGEDALVMWSGRLDDPAYRAALQELRGRLLARLEGHHDADPGPRNVL